MLRSALISFLLGAACLAQEAPPASADNAKKSTIEGQVFNLVTKEPLRRADVTVIRTARGGAEMSAAIRAALTATTDAEGKFKIENVEAGDYRIVCQKTGFLGGGRGAIATMSGPASQTVTVKSGETQGGLKFYLMPQGVVMGRVLDDEGEPVQGAMVSLMRWSYTRGVKSLQSRGRDTSNDRGEYRISNVPPGWYFIQANLFLGAATGPQVVGGVRMAYVPTFYPNVADAAQATRIQVTGGLELPGQDITLRREKVYTVRGRLLEPDGSPAKNALVGFAHVEALGVGGWPQAPVNDKGEYKADNLRSGTYKVNAMRLEEGSYAQPFSQTIQVGDSDIENVTVHLLPLLEASGTITVERTKEGTEGKGGGDGKDGAEGAENRLAYCSIIAVPPDRFGGARGQSKNDGTFKLEDLTPGRVMVEVRCGETSYVKSILVGEEDVLGKEVEAGALAAAGIKVIVRIDMASVTGTLDVPEDKRNPAKQPRIVLLPSDERLRQPWFQVFPLLDQNYHFSSKTVRPGEYQAFAFAEADNSSFDDPDFLRVVQSKGVKVKLGPGESQTVDLKLTPWPEEFADRLQ